MQLDTYTTLVVSGKSAVATHVDPVRGNVVFQCEDIWGYGDNWIGYWEDGRKKKITAFCLEQEINFKEFVDELNEAGSTIMVSPEIMKNAAYSVEMCNSDTGLKEVLEVCYDNGIKTVTNAITGASVNLSDYEVLQEESEIVVDAFDANKYPIQIQISTDSKGDTTYFDLTNGLELTQENFDEAMGRKFGKRAIKPAVTFTEKAPKFTIFGDGAPQDVVALTRPLFQKHIDDLIAAGVTVPAGAVIHPNCISVVQHPDKKVANDDINNVQDVPVTSEAQLDVVFLDAEGDSDEDDITVGDEDAIYGNVKVDNGDCTGKSLLGRELKDGDLVITGEAGTAYEVCYDEFACFAPATV